MVTRRGFLRRTGAAGAAAAVAGMALGMGEGTAATLKAAALPEPTVVPPVWDEANYWRAQLASSASRAWPIGFSTTYAAGPLYTGTMITAAFCSTAPAWSTAPAGTYRPIISNITLNAADHGGGST